jgi:Sec-independent protein translocase protein TatA
MDILGIGPMELALILIIALIVLGPNDMVKAGKIVGKFLRNIVTSPTWRMVQQTSRDLRYLPNKLMRDAGLDEIKEDLPKPEQLGKDMGLDEVNKELKEVEDGIAEWTTPPPTVKTPSTPLKASTETPAEPIEKQEIQPPPAPSNEKPSVASDSDDERNQQAESQENQADLQAAEIPQEIEKE